MALLLPLEIAFSFREDVLVPSPHPATKAQVAADVLDTSDSTLFCRLLMANGHPLRLEQRVDWCPLR